jgi:hypothetical protein
MNITSSLLIISGEMISIPVKIIPDYSGYLYSGIGLFFLFSIGLIYFFKEKNLKEKRKRVHA